MENSFWAERIARAGLNIHAIKLRPENPFQWASGYRMPIYNDNRMFLTHPADRHMIRDAFIDLMRGKGATRKVVVAGTSTAGIPWAALVAEQLYVPMIYVRDKPKDHGMKNQIEGIDAESDLEGKRVVLIEDLVSTGGSSVAAVQAIRDANGVCDRCFSVFSYGFSEAEEMFAGKRAYDKEGKRFLASPCEARPLLSYDTLLKVAKETGYLNADKIKLLEEWRADPWNWGADHGFPRVEKAK